MLRIPKYVSERQVPGPKLRVMDEKLMQKKPKWAEQMETPPQFRKKSFSMGEESAWEGVTGEPKVFGIMEPYLQLGCHKN